MGMSKKVTKSMFLSPITFVELKQKIASFKYKAGGYDGIHAYTLKTLSKNDGVVNALLFILNSCFFSGQCPQHFKIARTPIFKAGEKDIPGNYSSISLVSNLSKIYEGFLHTKIVRFLNKHTIFLMYQFGFRKGVGTKNAFASITQIIYEKIDISTSVLSGSNKIF